MTSSWLWRAADTTEEVAHAARAAFAGHGFTAPDTFVAEPGPGAGPLPPSPSRS